MDQGGQKAPHVDGFSDLRRIGRGGFSVVYSATQISFQRKVALKILDVTGSEARQLEREAAAFGELTGLPNIVQAHQIVTTDDGRPGFVMALMSHSLSNVIYEQGPIPLPQIRVWSHQITTALHRAHEIGIHHRDVKPQNVLISKFGDAHLADFGIASLSTIASETETVQSMSPPHAPPERFHGDNRNPTAGDIYSLASTIYCSLSGKAPFGTTSDGGVHGLTQRITSLDPPEHPLIPAPVLEVLRHALHKQAGNRPGTAEEFGAELSSAFERSGVISPDSAAVSGHAGTSATGDRVPADDRSMTDRWWLEVGPAEGTFDPSRAAIERNVAERGDPDHSQDAWWA